MKQSSRWYSPRVQQEVSVVRWGHYGKPVLIFPTAGGDAEEVERFLMIKALGDLLEAGRIKIYSCDSIAGRAWSRKEHPLHCAWLHRQFFSFVYRELVPAIRTDCGGADVEVIATGASIGAYNALGVTCRYPDVFSQAICMSGTYDIENWMQGHRSEDFYHASPLHFVPNLGEGEHLSRLRQRFILLPTGEGRWEDPSHSWRMAQVLGTKGIPNRVDPWGTDYDHDWPTWRAMLPKYLGEMT